MQDKYKKKDDAITGAEIAMCALEGHGAFYHDLEPMKKDAAPKKPADKNELKAAPAKKAQSKSSPDETANCDDEKMSKAN